MLKVSKNVGLSDVVSGANPINTQHPHTGSAQIVQLWLFNDDPTKKYENNSVKAQDISGSDESGWVQFSKDNATFSSTLALDNVTTANTGQLFYARITTPSVSDSQKKTDLQLKIDYTEYPV